MAKKVFHNAGRFARAGVNLIRFLVGQSLKFPHWPVPVKNGM